MADNGMLLAHPAYRHVLTEACGTKAESSRTEAHIYAIYAYVDHCPPECHLLIR